MYEVELLRITRNELISGHHIHPAILRIAGREWSEDVGHALQWFSSINSLCLKGLSHCHDLSGRSPHVVPVLINLSKREKDWVSILETHFYNVYAAFIPTLVRSEHDERSAHVARSGVLTPSSQRPCRLLHVCNMSATRPPRSSHALSTSRALLTRC